MKQGIISKKDVKQLVSSIRKNYTVYGPVKDSDGVVLTELTSDEEIVLDYYNFRQSPKSFFFPQCEVIGTFDDNTLHDIPLSEGKFVILGIRPCDARALQRLDRVFNAEDIKDPYYLKKREIR